jgi:hypothetical protein
VELKPTSKQLELLKSKGVAEEELAKLTRKEASNRINQIFTEENQGKAPGEKMRMALTGLLEASDEIMQHIQSSEIYAGLSEDGRTEAFKAVVDAYTRMRNSENIRRK